MKKAMNRCLVAGLAVAFGVMMGCEKQSMGSAETAEKKVKAASADVDPAVKPLQTPERSETAIPKDHPAH